MVGVSMENILHKTMLDFPQTNGDKDLSLESIFFQENLINPLRHTLTNYRGDILTSLKLNLDITR